MALISGVTEAAFAERRRADWGELDRVVTAAQARGLRRLSPDDVARLTPLYRDTCADLARAEAARYSAGLVDYLQGLTAAAHTVVYGARPRSASALSALAEGARAFPRALRERRRAFALAFALFFVPLALSLVATLLEPSFALRVAPESQLRPLADAYAQGFAHGRAGGEGALMTGFYVNNNVGIALRCFALGIFGGLGSAFFLVYNGVTIGAVIGWVIAHGAGANILAFVVGHGPFELGAIVIAGAAGLSLGWAVVAPGERTRLASLQTVARDVLVLVLGAAVMLLVAALIEGLWSGSSVPNAVKYGVGGASLLVVTLYLALVGRPRAKERGGAPWT